MFTIHYDGDSTHVLASAFKALDDGYDWFVLIKHWVSDDTSDGGHEESMQGIVRSVALGDKATVTIQPTEDDGITVVGQPVTLDINNVFDLNIP